MKKKTAVIFAGPGTVGMYMRYGMKLHKTVKGEDTVITLWDTSFVPDGYFALVDVDSKVMVCWQVFARRHLAEQFLASYILDK